VYLIIIYEAHIHVQVHTCMHGWYLTWHTTLISVQQR
jgi:hypothetical protein